MRHATLRLSLFFLFGALLHFLCWRLFVHLIYEGLPADSRAIVNAPLTNVAITLLGGASLTFFMAKLFRKTLERVTLGPLKTMTNAGLYGLAATFCAFEIFYVLSAAYSVVSPGSPVHAPGFGLVFIGFIQMFIELQAFGAFAVALALPFSFLFCFLAGFAIWKASTRQDILRSHV